MCKRGGGGEWYKQVVTTASHNTSIGLSLHLTRPLGQHEHPCALNSPARTTTIPDQYWSLPSSRQTVAVTLSAALIRHGTSARTGSNGHAREMTKSYGTGQPSQHMHPCQSLDVDFYSHVVR